MAFRHSTYQAPQRVYTLPDKSETQALAERLAQPSQNVAESQEWILFDPSAASTTDRTYTTSSAQTQTAGRSRISDFGSLDTAARSYGYDADGRSGHTEDLEEDGELDSLDSHLQEFRAEPSVYRSSGVGEASTSVLPQHDGLGSFRVDQALMGDDMQEQLYAFERYNPRRIKRRRESLELGQLELDNERAAEAERTRRIEKWRMEQSRLLVDEIQKETRRRKMSMASERRSVVVDREQEDIATLSTVDSSGSTDVADDTETFLNRITKRLIHDLMGIDDDLLSIIFGESIPVDDDLSSTPRTKATSDIQNGLISMNGSESWEYRLVERIARELGLLVNGISDHPGAFSTYLNSQQPPLPYAGLPIIPETARDQPVPSQLQESTLTSPNPEFLPTIQNSQAMPIPISGTSLAPSPLREDDSTPRASNPLSREEWERDLDVKMVFRYLRSRFTTKFQSSPPAPAPISSPDFFTTHGTSHLATASTSETAARAARVRQHHPLVTRQNSTPRRRQIERRTFKVSVPGGVAGGGLVRRGSSSCASEHLSAAGAALSAVGTKRNSGSSRHYWDFGNGGSTVGSGSMIASTGGMGSWGEV
ncbi:hypothetical protein HYALB_00001175 [Hymenoscyphus albidus]|uniref:Uncharacterized protein n=1 Tax=Hymenoscyphus albidus TaxID=595503 RepID=A0A9N9LC08_9HELO|nr:hypothetical protein HYALB_00001175 [Hymenoscyphus albidus]